MPICPARPMDKSTTKYRRCSYSWSSRGTSRRSENGGGSPLSARMRKRRKPHRPTPIGQERRRGDAPIAGYYVNSVRGHSNSQEVGMQQPVPACHDSSPQMRPACLHLYPKPRIAPSRCPNPSSTPDACYRELLRIPLLRTPVNKGRRPEPDNGVGSLVTTLLLPTPHYERAPLIFSLLRR